MTPELSRIYTYKELCELFNQKYRDGKSKMYQLREWSRYFKWEHPVNPKTHKKGKKFLITEIYDKPKEKLDGRKNNGGYRENSGNIDRELQEIFCDYIYYCFKECPVDIKESVFHFVCELKFPIEMYSKKISEEYKEIRARIEKKIETQWISACKKLGVIGRINLLLDNHVATPIEEQRYHDYIKEFCGDRSFIQLSVGEKVKMYKNIYNHFGCNNINHGIYAKYKKIKDYTPAYTNYFDILIRMHELILDRIDKRINNAEAKYKNIMYINSLYENEVSCYAFTNQAIVDAMVEIMENNGIKGSRTVLNDFYYTNNSIQYEFDKLRDAVDAIRYNKIKIIDIQHENPLTLDENMLFDNVDLNLRKII